MNIVNNRNYLYLGLLLSLGLGFSLGNIWHSHNTAHCDYSGFKYINQSLECEGTDSVRKNNYVSLKKEVETFILEKKKYGEVKNVSIYFRDLQNGPTLGINEHELFSPASLLKLPLYLTYQDYRSDNDATFFERKIPAVTNREIPKQLVPPKEYARHGEMYTIGELLRLMIQYSDNTAYYALLDYMNSISPDRDLLKDTFVSLGIIDPKDFLDNTISVKAYGSIFVQLFHESYFNKKEISNEVLTMLAGIDWKKGLNKGVPEGIDVAHKFGERTSVPGALFQLHDCGIVYYPENPYMLCVMTRGDNMEELAEVISDISKMFYEEFDSRKIES